MAARSISPRQLIQLCTRNLPGILCSTIVAGCATYTSSGDGTTETAPRRHEIDASVDRAPADLCAQAPVIGYVLDNRGPMVNLSIDGTKFTELNLTEAS